MFYLTEIEDYVRVEPKLFGLATIEAVEKQLRETYADYYDKEVGKVVSVIEILEVGEGVIIPGDGAAYYNSKFKLLTWKPEIHEIVYGSISEIANFGAFMDLGVMRGMIHISQTMDDFVSFSKDKTLAGKESKRSLKVNDVCRARIIAVSFKDPLNPKLGLTMRQQGLGRLDWIEEDEQKSAKKEETKKGPKKDAKGKSKKK